MYVNMRRYIHICTYLIMQKTLTFQVQATKKKKA